MFWEILTNVSSAADLLKRIRADPSPVKMAIVGTAQAFPDIEGIEQHLASLWDDKEMQKLLNESASSGADIPIQVLTRRFVEFATVLRSLATRSLNIFANAAISALAN